ncbi:contact-dependent growth inhibition system immunity protein [Belnapia sp. F-4-1]|uniref:contact-dependent growth inhibition system immunity protein n=1 Tax=Belnapia sp. F-4-1 TaxID=1545443 RepID=UPI0005BD1339|nr:contact-dependent growth inhibition system immunity protein [Belnapia sp. F-4-1]
MPALYPHLAGFIQAWFHQDCDLDGDDADIVAEARRVTPAAERALLAAEIRRFLADHPGSLADAAFLRHLEPDIDPSANGQSTADWLGVILRLLEQP